MSDQTNSKPEGRGPQSRILYLFTRTPLHVGAGSSVGAIDQPIVRERHTGFPVIPGSSIKGVLASCEPFLARNDKGEYERTPLGYTLFGKQDDAGKLTFGEARVLAFPVRSARGGARASTWSGVIASFR